MSVMIRHNTGDVFVMLRHNKWLKNGTREERRVP